MLIALVIAMLAGIGAQSPPTAHAVDVTIFVGPQTRNGFVDVDKGVLESIKRVASELRGKRGLRVVATKDEAQIVLEVVSFGATSSTGGGAVGVPIGTLNFFLPIGTVGIASDLRVGDYEKPIVLQNCEAVRRCAKLTANDVETWVGANPSIAKRQP